MVLVELEALLYTFSRGEESESSVRLDPTELHVLALDSVAFLYRELSFELDFKIQRGMLERLLS